MCVSSLRRAVPERQRAITVHHRMHAQASDVVHIFAPLMRSVAVEEYLRLRIQNGPRQLKRGRDSTRTLSSKVAQRNAFRGNPLGHPLG